MKDRKTSSLFSGNPSGKNGNNFLFMRILKYPELMDKIIIINSYDLNKNMVSKLPYRESKKLKKYEK